MLRTNTAVNVGHLDTLVASWVRHLRAENKSPMTIRNYVYSAERLIEFLQVTGMPIDASSTKREHVEAFIVDVLERSSPSTAATRYRGLQQFFRWLLEEGEISTSPMERMSPPKLDEKPVPVIPEENLARLLKATDGRSFEDRRDTAILRVFLNTGARLTEIADLRADQVDLDRGELYVRRKGAREQALSMTDKAIKAVDRYARVRSRHSHNGLEWFWIGPKGRLTSSGIAQMLRRRCREAGIDPLHPHQFRHTWAHIMKSHGISDDDLMKLGGWRSQQMVMRYGASAATERAKEAHRRIAPGDDL